MTRTKKNSVNDITTTESTRDWSNWSSTALASYLESKGLGNYGEVFIANDITGEVAPNLTDQNLREMGVSSIGDRIRIRETLQTLRQSKAMKQREQVLWEGREVLYFSWVHRLCATGCGCCPNDPSTYSLRRNHLEIKTVNPCRFGPIACCSCCCGPKYEIDSVDLSQITDADVKGVPPNCIAQTCCCGDTQEHVVITTKAEGAKILRLKKNEGQQVARRIKNQVESMQVMERS